MHSVCYSDCLEYGGQACSELFQKDLKERQTQQQNVRTQLHDRRMQSARARQYYDDYQVRMRSKMLKKRTKEELVGQQYNQNIWTSWITYI